MRSKYQNLITAPDIQTHKRTNMEMECLASYVVIFRGSVEGVGQVNG